MSQVDNRPPPPAAFSYLRNVESKGGRALKRYLERAAGTELSLSDDIVDNYGRSMNQGDELGDAYIDAMFTGRRRSQSRSMVETALTSGIESVTDAPVELTALFKQIDTEPDWLDWALVEHGAQVFRQYGIGLYDFFGMITFTGYRNPTVAKPLVLALTPAARRLVVFSRPAASGPIRQSPPLCDPVGSAVAQRSWFVCCIPSFATDCCRIRNGIGRGSVCR